jgi:FtsP/CotA-like multicopper oxidase with cupredoxin domain/plastocyanin
MLGSTPAGAWVYQDPGLPGTNLNVLGGCPSNAPVRTYNVTALIMPVVYNHWGDFDPNGRVFVPTELVTDVLNSVISNLTKATLYNATVNPGPPYLLRMVQNLTAARDAYAAQDLATVVDNLGYLQHALYKDQNATNELIQDINATGINPPDVSSLVQPLILRARLGECVKVTLRNLLPEAVSIHVHGALTKPGQGTDLGADPDDLTLPGLTRVYSAYIPTAPGMEGAHFLHSHADSRYQTKHGLFGAVVAESAGSTWTAPDGSARNWGQDAIIVPPSSAAFREYVLMYHDEVELWNVAHFPLANSTAPGQFGCSEQFGVQLPTDFPVCISELVFAPFPVISPYGEYGPGSKGLNLRAEPFMDRFLLHDFLNDAYSTSGGLAGLPTPHDKSMAYSSYTYGDPATFFARAYVGDSTKWRVVNAGPGQSHVHHLHGGGDRWRESPVADDTQLDLGLSKDNPVVRSASERVDVQNMGPGESFNTEIEGGAGGVQQSVGDFLYHCHIVEHYLAGMWGFWRVYNTLQPGLAELPDREDQVHAAVNSTGLLGKTLPDDTVLDAGNIRAWVESQLPPPGLPGVNDASVWDWTVEGSADAPLYKGEALDNNTWPNYVNPTQAGVRPLILFDPDNGRLAWPMMQPHLGKRAPFAPGHGPSPYLGATNADHRHPDALCPQSAPAQRNYTIVAVNVAVHFNDFDSDAAGSVFMRAEDKDTIMQDPRLATSLVIRANQGDCVNIVFSSQLDAGNSKVNMHTHLVQFDVQGSDGVITGFNYEQSVRPADSSGTTFVSASGTTLTVDDGSKLRNGTLIGIGLTQASVEVRRVFAVNGDEVTLDEALYEPHQAGDLVGVEFVRYQWYPDVELGMVYWHDHVDGLHSWLHGLYGGLVVEPAGSDWCDPKAIDACQSLLSGQVVDVKGSQDAADRSKTYREFVLQVQDRACTTAFCTAGTVNPGAPNRETEPAALNLRSEPLWRRNLTYPLANWANWSRDDEGTPDVDETLVAQGDPRTPALAAYPGDPVVIRLLYAGQSTSTGVATFSLTGHRFHVESNLTGSRLVDAVSIGISSQRNLYVEDGAGGRYGIPGDYLYYLTNPDLFDRGAWGVFRVYNTTDTARTHLRMLESNQLDPAANLDHVLPAGESLVYNVTALQTSVVLNQRVNISSVVKLFALNSEVDGILSGDIRPMPLVLRAKPGQNVTVNLTNNLAERVSLHASLLPASPKDGLGIPVGNNSDTSVGSGESRNYTWNVDKELGVAYLTSFGTLQTREMNTGRPTNPASFGLYGALVVEPADSDIGDWTGMTSYVTHGGTRFREHVLLYGSDDREFEASNMPYTVEVQQPVLHPDHFAVVNYRADPLGNRVCPAPLALLIKTCYALGMGASSCQVDTNQCGGLFLPTVARFEVRNPLNPLAFSLYDPETPRLDAVQGEPLVVRAVVAAGDQLGVHSVDGHWWALDPNMTDCRTDLTACRSNLISSVLLGPGEVSNAWIPEPGPAGPGDYLWYNHRDPFLEAGLWGILTVCTTNLLSSTGNPSGPACSVNNPKPSIADQVGNATDPFAKFLDQAANNPVCATDFIGCMNATLAQVSCLEANATSSETVFIPPLAAAGVPSNAVFWGFQPLCVAVSSGGTVSFVNEDPVAANHDPSTLVDSAASEGGKCFKSAWDRDGDNLQFTQPGSMPKLQPTVAASQFHVKLQYNGVSLLASVDGGLHWRDCSALKDTAYSTSALAVLRYRCDVHPNMRGDVVVKASAGGSGSLYTYEGSSSGQDAVAGVVALLLVFVSMLLVGMRGRRSGP